MQKSHIDWIKLGDGNTRFFHTSTLVRRRRNKIDELRDDVGQWISDGETLKDMAVQYYKELFSSRKEPGGDFITEHFPTIGMNTKKELSRDVSMEEALKALKGMGSYKAPRPDGFQAIFYKKTWSKIGKSVHSFVKKMLEDGEVLEEAAEAILMLIPKETKPSRMRGFRRLGLCNIVHKLASKVVVNRLKDILKTLISPCQASFVPGRQGIDNVVIYQEFVH